MTRNEEGFVVRDKYFNRIKIKSPEYLLAFHMNNNGVITIKRIINMMKNEQIDDFLAYCPEYSDMVHNVSDALNKVCKDMESDWNYIRYYLSPIRAEFASYMCDVYNRAWCWARYDNPSLTPIEYIMNQPTKKIQKMIERTRNGY